MAHPTAFICITFLSFFMFYHGTGKDRKVLFFFPVWAAITGLLSYSGFFQDTDAFPPRILIIIIPSVIYVVYFYKKIEVSKLKPNLLLTIHILRLPVELALYQLFLSGKIPVIMTFKGWNFDILIGISAIALLLYRILGQGKLYDNVFKVWNILGLIFLTAIVTIAVLSAPSPLQQLAFNNPNLAIISFPYTLLAAIIVPIVLLSHLLCLKQIRIKRDGYLIHRKAICE